MNENKGDVYVESMKLFKYSRTSTLIFLKKSDETIWDIQPENFPNTIRWNAGHVYAEAEKFMHDAANDYEIMKLIKKLRAMKLIFLKKLDGTIWDIQPENFPNTIRWNAGHVYGEAEKFMHDAANDYEVTRPRWMDLFLDGTRPSEWEGD